MSTKQSQSDAGIILNETALHQARQVENEIGKALNESQGLATLIESAVKNRKKIDRIFLNNYIKGALNINPFFFGTWVMVDPHGLEGNDTVECKDGKGLPGTIYCPYAYREGDSTAFSLGTFYDAVVKDYYKVSHGSGKPGLIDPYIEPDAGSVIMTSTTVPIFDNEKIIGVAGIDLVLKSFNEKMRAVTPFKKGRAFLIGNNGLIVGHPVDSLAGKPATVLGLSPDCLDSIREGKSFDKTISCKPDNIKSRIISVP
jgi:methyl-accepting chemotaxis protein